jgi:hypothetical protein
MRAYHFLIDAMPTTIYASNASVAAGLAAKTNTPTSDIIPLDEDDARDARIVSALVGHMRRYKLFMSSPARILVGVPDALDQEGVAEAVAARVLSRAKSTSRSDAMVRTIKTIRKNN